jgi:glycosyltransferase involved in cell wall biosynthesis
MHRRAHFDAILAFDLIATGGLAWKLGRDLEIPAAGWSTASEPMTETSPFASAVLRSVDRLQLIFYQSREKQGEVARLLGVSVAELMPDKHVVLSRGVPVPPPLSKREVRSRVRREWGVTEEQIVVLSVGRITRAKGVFELFDAVSLAAARDPRVVALLIGSRPALDETEAVEARLQQIPGLRDRVRILPGCSPELVWEYLCAADIFAFPSHREGMPNSLLEAMAMEVPSIAFAIPPVDEIDAGTGALVLVPPLDSARFADEIVRLASEPGTRVLIGKAGEAQVRKRFDVTRNMAAAFGLLVEMRARWMASSQ